MRRGKRERRRAAFVDKVSAIVEIHVKALMRNQLLDYYSVGFP